MVEEAEGGKVMIREDRSRTGAIDGGGRMTGRGRCQWSVGCDVTRRRGKAVRKIYLGGKAVRKYIWVEKLLENIFGWKRISFDG